MRKIDFKSIVWEEGDYYISQCLEADVSSFGKSRKEALASLQEALELYFEDIPIRKKVEVKNPVIASVKIQQA